MKNYIITGATTELGKKLSTNLSKKNRIILISKTETKLHKLHNKLQSKNTDFIALDFEKKLNLGSLENKIKELFNNRIDGVVHITGAGLGLKDYNINYDDIIKLLNLNLLNAIQINNLALKYMIKKKCGNLLHVGSIASHEAVGSVGYNISKSSLSTYVRSLGREVAKYNIIVNGISPGGFIAKGNAMDRLKKRNIKAYNDFINSRLPRKKMGVVDELLPFLEFLLSKNSGMATSCMIPLDAGEGKFYT